MEAHAKMLAENSGQWRGIIGRLQQWNVSETAQDYVSNALLELISDFISGKIDEEAMVQENFTINELQERLRVNNVSNLGDVEFAILETSGQISVVLKPEKRALKPEDFNIQAEYEGIAYDLVIDGKIMSDNLSKIGKDYRWLEKEVRKFNMKPEEALVVVLNGDGSIFCQKKDVK